MIHLHRLSSNSKVSNPDPSTGLDPDPAQVLILIQVKTKFFLIDRQKNKYKIFETDYQILPKSAHVMHININLT